jgi:glutamate 5-kinase
MKSSSSGISVDRAALLRPVRRIVVKVGTYLLTGKGTPLDPEMIRKIAAEIADLRRRGKDVVLVTSGAIGAGVLELKLPGRPRDLPGLQAAAAVGQAGLMHLYRTAFAAHGLTVGQILLTREDVRRRLNVRHTLFSLLQGGVVPIINENDSVAVDEIKFGDNDYLAALVAVLIRAELLVLLTDVEGLLRPQGSGLSVIPIVERITPELQGLAGGSDKELSRGGMRSKMEAGRIMSRSGGMMAIASGRRPGVLAELIEGRPTGTLFLADPKRAGEKQWWIAFSRQRKGTITVDDGARRALVSRGKSLLASGVTAIAGDVRPGEMVGIAGPDGIEFARGLSNYGTEDLKRIRGKKTSQIAALLGRLDYEEVVHRDNLLIL